MKNFLHPSLVAAGAVLLAIVVPKGSTLAFPPAPHQTVYGMVRDEQGNPITSAKAAVFMELGGKVVATAAIAPSLSLGVDYRLSIPIDAGITADRYQATAALPAVPFRLRVVINGRSYLPIEMSGASSLVTEAAARSRVDLTLGEDTDGDGLPDAWERNLIAAMRSKQTIADIRPEDDAEKDGASNLTEYLAGTYAFDPKEGFSLAIGPVEAGRAALDFTAIRGRSYTIHASTDMASWEPVQFALSGDSAAAAKRDAYNSTDVRPVRVWVDASTSGEHPQPRFFRLMVH